MVVIMIYQWAVIGAGPAGIAAVGNLLDHDVSGESILWVDPKFNAGDFGTIWSNVPSNTTVKLFIKFLLACNSFAYSTCPHDFDLHHQNQDQTCNLRLMAEPLIWVTEQLKKQVHPVQDFVEKLSFSDGVWTIHFKDIQLKVNKVILAIGAEPKCLPISSVPIISLQDAMDSERLKNHVSHEDTVAVFGSSHSAILILRNLVEQKVKHIINFYRQPLRYAIPFEDWILFDDTGLKGTTAEWARSHIDSGLLHNVERIYSDENNIKNNLSRCTKAIYAIGFERRVFPKIEHLENLTYNEQCGIIAPGLFGLGIAFPEAKYNPIGMLEYRVGLWKFMEYLKRVMPIWLNYPASLP